MNQSIHTWLKENLNPAFLLPLYVIGLELLLHFEIYGRFDVNMVHAVLFSLPFSFAVLLIGNTKWKTWNLIWRTICMLLYLIYFAAQIIYYQVFGNFMSVKSIINGAGQAMDFGFTIKEALKEHVGLIGFAVLGFAVYVWAEVVFVKKKNSREVEIGLMKEQEISLWQKNVICLISIFAIPFFATLLLIAEGTGVSSAYSVKMNFNRTEQSMYRLGLTETLVKDVRENICDAVGISQKELNAGYLWIEEYFVKDSVDKFAGRNGNSKDLQNGNDLTNSKNGEDGGNQDDLENTTTEEAPVSYHTWDIDFETLIQNETDEEVKELHTYFAGLTPTAENEYTGLFEGYNLIYITAESFSDVIIDKDRTPTLYRMQQEGFQFENFYTPSWYLSTIDGEYVNCLGQIPVDGDWSLQHSADNTLSMALGNQLKNKGYTCNAYHNHDSYYYDRTKTHPTLGYEFKAVGAGLTFESMYPESDLELMEITSDEYINEAPFHTYYMTMSGHLPYEWDYDSMGVKNRETVEDLEVSDNAACYLAANTELEYAVEYLVKELEKAGQLDKTLFVIAADHYPYGLKKGVYDELRGVSVEDDAFEIYRNTCLIWSASMKDMEKVTFPVKVEKYGSNLDILPTVSNLMGLSYDSRLLAGRDLLSDDFGIVLFKDHSFLTDKVRYNATTGEAVWKDLKDEDSAYLEKCMELVENRFYYSAGVLNKDYLKVVQTE